MTGKMQASKFGKNWVYKRKEIDATTMLESICITKIIIKELVKTTLFYI